MSHVAPSKPTEAHSCAVTPGVERNNMRTCHGVSKFLLIVLCFFFPALAVAGDLSRCPELTLPGSHDFGESGWVDHGAGVVSYVSWGSVGTGGDLFVGARLHVEACRARQGVAIGLYDRSVGDGVDPARNFDVHDAVRARFTEMLGADEVYRLADVSAEMTQISPSVRFYPELSRQSCACAVAYPFARGFDHMFDRSLLR